MKQRFENFRSSLMDTIANKAREYAQANFDVAEYDGDNIVVVSSDVAHDYMPGYSDVTISAMGMRDVEPCNVALFIEFGTGVVYPDDHPEAEENDMIRGEYGAKYGRNEDGWTYIGNPGTNGTINKDGSVHTFGNPANMCMYRARETMRDEIVEEIQRRWHEL